MRDFIRQFLLYSRSERRAVVVMVVLIVMVLVLPKVYRFYAVKHSMVFIDSTLVKGIAARNDDDSDTNISITREVNSSGIGLFYFDPNTISIADWGRLGLSEKQAKSIEKYRSKGGKFKTPDDLGRMYVLSNEMKDRLVPYVRINGIDNKESPTGSYNIEINKADSAAFEALYGIGPVLSARIIKYRKALGGFYQIEQIAEVHGVSDSTYRLIRPHLSVNPELVLRINLNTADYETLQKHPYIHAKIAHAIIEYRKTNGKFETIGQLKELKPITDEVLKKIIYYLKTD